MLLGSLEKLSLQQVAEIVLLSLRRHSIHYLVELFKNSFTTSIDRNSLVFISDIFIYFFVITLKHTKFIKFMG